MGAFSRIADRTKESAGIAREKIKYSYRRFDRCVDAHIEERYARLMTGDIVADEKMERRVKNYSFAAVLLCIFLLLAVPIGYAAVSVGEKIAQQGVAAPHEIAAALLEDYK